MDCRTAADFTRKLASLGLGLALLAMVPDARAATDPALAEAAAKAKQSLEKTHGAAESERIGRGVDQVLRYWRKEDGDAAQLASFVEEEFVPAGEAVDAVFARFEFAQERIGGYFTSMVRDLRRGVDLDLGPLLPLDRRFAGYNPAAHVSDDLFGNKIAFVALLNFPLTTLDERIAKGMDWSRRQWAEARLAQQFSTRVPADVSAKVTMAYAAADAYISDYNIYMHHLVTRSGRPFPAGMRLISHWNLRDELKARYDDPSGLPSQRLIQKVMERIVRQEIPAAVVNNPLLDWNPVSNTVKASTVKDTEPPPGASAEARAGRELDERYRQWLAIFQAERLQDPYYPDNPSHIDRRFNLNREIPEPQAKALLEAVLTSPVGDRVARLIETRLGRPLEPFDIWYAGFKRQGGISEEDASATTRRKYPTPEAYAADIPRLLKALGFSNERSQFLADHIVVDPSRGAGHAFGATRRDDEAHLRTRVGSDGMDYKGYNIAIHEMGHNVEQVFSVTTIDHTLLQGVPNTAFTEALAFVFQARDLELLGMAPKDSADGGFAVLDKFWQTREIAGVALVDMEVWHWMYAHPDATPAQLREAVIATANHVWNRYYAPIFKKKDVPLLAIYSHMIDSGLYTPDYPIGHLIAFQIEDHFRKLSEPEAMTDTGGLIRQASSRDPLVLVDRILEHDSIGAEFERICQLGSITPDAWMRKAVGSPLSADPLIAAADKAVEESVARSPK